MNKERRKKLEKVVEKLEELKSDLEALTGEEQEYMDNMPENLFGGERYTNAENAISYLEDAAQSIQEAMDHIVSATD